MTNIVDTHFSAWQVAADVATELSRADPALIAVPIIVGAIIAVGIHYLRSGVWIPLFINSDYRQGGASFGLCLVAGGVTTLGIVGYWALGSVERAAEGWRERQGAGLSVAADWQMETFQQLFNEVRNSKLEDLSNVPDPIANGGNQLPLTNPESWKLASRFYQDATWQRLVLDSAPLQSSWPKNPLPSTIPTEPGLVTQLPTENPALFAAIENSTRVAAQNALESVRPRVADFQSAIIVTILLFQALAWLASSVSATRDIGGDQARYFE